MYSAAKRKTDTRIMLSVINSEYIYIYFANNMMYERRRRLGTETETKLVLYRVNVITLIMKYFTFGLINIRLNKVTSSV